MILKDCLLYSPIVKCRWPFVRHINKLLKCDRNLFKLAITRRAKNTEKSALEDQIFLELLSN